MRQFVIVEIRRGRETLVADLTHMRLFTRMDSTVGVQRRRGRERLRAHVTAMGLLARVSSDVSSEKRGPIERLETRLALPHSTLALFVDTQRLQRLSRRVCRCNAAAAVEMVGQGRRAKNSVNHERHAR